MTTPTTLSAATDHRAARSLPSGGRSRGRRVRRSLRSAVRPVVVVGLALAAAVPLYYILVSAFKTQLEMAQNPLGLPSALRWDNFVQAFAQNDMGTAFRNSIILTLGAVVLQVVIGSMASYGVVIGSKRFTGVVGAVLMLAFAVPLQATLVPQFRMFARAGLTDSLIGVMLLYSSASVFCYFLIVGYMRTLPKELFEAARMDGANPLRIYWQIILPLCRPILVTVVVVQTMGIWNDFMIPSIYLSSPSNRTVVLQVFNAVGQFSTNWPLFMATTVIVLAPVFIFFIFCQKWIVSGLVAGSVKG